MSNKSTQFAQNTSIAKQNLRNGKTIDYAKNLAEFRNVISYIDAQLKEGKDNPLIIKTCQNLIRTISGLDLPADVKRHELAVAPSSVQKLYQQMTQSKNGNSSSSRLRQEAIHNAIQQSLKEQIANLHNMSKAERMEFYKRIMTAESLQEAINNGFIVNDEFANALLDKAEADLQRLEYLKNQIAELEEKDRNDTITSEERVRLQQYRDELPKAEEKARESQGAVEVAQKNFRGNDRQTEKRLNTIPERYLKAYASQSMTCQILIPDSAVQALLYDNAPPRSEPRINITEDNFRSGHLTLEPTKETININIDTNTNTVGKNVFNRWSDIENVRNPNFLDKAINNSDSEQYVPTETSTYTTSSLSDIFSQTNPNTTFIENHNVDKVVNDRIGEDFTISKELYTKPDFGDMVTLSSAQKNELTEENNIIVGGREEVLAMFANRTDVNAKDVFNLNTAGYEFNNIPQTSSANEPAAGLDEIEKAVKIAKLEVKVKNRSITQEERQELEQFQLEMVKANQQANENKYISSFIQVNTQPKPVKTDENTEEHNKPIQNNETDVQAFILNNASFGLEESIITTAEKVDEVKNLKQSDFWNQMDTIVLSSYKKVIEEKSGINKVVSNTTAKPNKATEPKKESTPNKPSAGKTEQKNDLASNATAKPNKATEPKKESSLNKTLASNTEQKNDFAPNTTTQTGDITENKNDIFNQPFAPTTDVTSYDVPTNFTLADSGQQSSSLTGALSAASYNPYEPMTPSFGNAR